MIQKALCATCDHCRDFILFKGSVSFLCAHLQIIGWRMEDGGLLICKACIEKKTPPAPPVPAHAA